MYTARSISVFVLIFFCILAGRASAGEYQKANTLYIEGCALLSENPDKAEKVLLDCVSELPSYRGYFALGQARMVTGKSSLAYESFKKARDYSRNDEEKSLSLAKIAQVMALEGDSFRAVQLLQEAEELHPSPPAWITQLRKYLDVGNLDKVVESDTISRSLADAKAWAPVGKVPGIKLQINFRTDMASLDSKGWRQVEKLAEALASEQFNGNRFKVVGHTDIKGDAAYNQDLSERRAQTVLAELISLSPSLKGRLEAEGRGEKELLYNGMDEDSHRLNRRVEVKVLNREGFVGMVAE